MWNIALTAAFASLMAGVVALSAAIYHSLSTVIVWSFVGSVLGLAVYWFFMVSLEHSLAVGWQGFSWMVVGALFSLTAFTAWREIKH
jgi:hypothetical protein